jgi:hypothetical protein
MPFYSTSLPLHSAITIKQQRHVKQYQNNCWIAKAWYKQASQITLFDVLVGYDQLYAGLYLQFGTIKYQQVCAAKSFMSDFEKMHLPSFVGVLGNFIMNKHSLFVLFVGLLAAGAANAQNIDGLYRPTGAFWSCSPDQVGMDGGALSIQNGIFHGVENHCRLTSPAAAGSGTKYLAVCSAEGTEYQEEMTLTPTMNGIKIERDGRAAVFWTGCGAL